MQGQRLVNAAADVEGQFQRAKWRLIAEAMENAGAAKYSNSFIQKKYDELVRNPDIFGSMIDDESSDASESDTITGRNDVARLQGPGAVSTMARAQPRSEKSHASSYASTTHFLIASGSGTMIIGEDESPGSGHRRKREPSSEFRPTVSHEEAEYMAGHKALNASNQAKPWEVIAQECGIIAPLNDLTRALTQAGYLDASGSAREAHPNKSAKMSRVGERRPTSEIHGRNGRAPKEIRDPKHARKEAYPSAPVDKRLLTTMTSIQRHTTSGLPTQRDKPDHLGKGSQPTIISQRASISGPSSDRNEHVQAKKKVSLALTPRDPHGTHGKHRYRRPRPYECISCLGRYRKQSGLESHWARNPGCNPMRRSNAAKTRSKATAATEAPRASKKESIAESLSHAPKVQVVIEISSKDPTPEINR